MIEIMIKFYSNSVYNSLNRKDIINYKRYKCY